MQKTPKEKCEKPAGSTEPEGVWSEDQKERGYYYDDAHGYEVYKPDDEGEPDDLDKN